MPEIAAPSRAQEINQLHNEICGAVRTTLDKAIRIGELLKAQKEEEGHSKWEAWMTKNLSFSKETARNYMRVYRFRDELKSVNVTDLSEAYRQASKILKKADDPPKEVEVKFTLSESEAAVYADHWEYLKEVYHTTDEKDTILAALKFAYEASREGHNG